MGRFHHSKKAHSDGKRKKNNKFTVSKTGNKKLEDDFVYTQKHKNIWNSFCNFLDERFAERNSGRRRDSKIKNLSNNSSTSGIYPNEYRRRRFRRREKSQKSSATSRRQILREQGSLLSGRTQEMKTKIQQSNSSGSETCRCADQLRSPSISQVQSNQETGAGSQI
jgi:hypothetical protein